MHWLDEAYVKFGAWSFLSFEIVSYFDIRISNLVAARGRARFIRGYIQLPNSLTLNQSKQSNPYSKPIKQFRDLRPTTYGLRLTTYDIK